MELKDLFWLLWRNVRLLILGLVLGAIVGMVAGKIEAPVYESTTKILVSHRQQGSTDVLPLSDDQLVAINLQLAKAQPTLDQAAKLLGSKIDPDAIQVSAIPNSQMIQIKVQDEDPKRAAAIGNLLVQTIIQQNQTLLSDRYTAFEDAINKQLDQVQAQIGDLQTQVNQSTNTNIQEQLKEVNQQIDQLKAQIASLQEDIANAPAVLTPVERASIAAKQAQLDQLNALLSTYMQIQTNLTYIGRPGQTGAERQDPALAALQSTLALYQQINLNLINNREAVDMVRMQSAKAVVQLVQASPAKEPIRPRPMLYFLLGGLLGFCLAVTYVVLAEHLDESLRSASQTEKSLGIPVLGSVLDSDGVGSDLVAVSAPFSTEASAFRALGANVDLLCVKKKARTLMVVNALPEAAKSSIVANLAIVYAQQGKRVILVDGDIRHPHLHAVFQQENQDGLAEIIYEKLNLKSACLPVKGVEGLKLIPGGIANKDTTEWLDAGKLTALFRELKDECDLVILDGPSPEVADAQVFASTVDALLLAIHSGQVSLDSAQETLRKFQLIHANVMGAVLYRRIQARSLPHHILAWARIGFLRKRKESYEEKSKGDQAPTTAS